MQTKQVEPLGFIIIAVIATLWIIYGIRAEIRCDNAGGTYLMREMKCLAVEQIKP